VIARLVLFRLGRALLLVLALLLLSLTGCTESEHDYSFGVVVGVACGVYMTLELQREWRKGPRP